MDYAVAGWLTKPLTGNVALSTANAPDDEARAAMIGAGLDMLETVGVSFSPLTGRWSLTRDTAVNYIVSATRGE